MKFSHESFILVLKVSYKNSDIFKFDIWTIHVWHSRITQLLILRGFLSSVHFIFKLSNQVWNSEFHWGYIKRNEDYWRRNQHSNVKSFKSSSHSANCTPVIWLEWYLYVLSPFMKGYLSFFQVSAWYNTRKLRYRRHLFSSFTNHVSKTF